MLHHALHKGDQAFGARASVFQMDTDIGAAGCNDPHQFTAYHIIQPSPHDGTGDPGFSIQLPPHLIGVMCTQPLDRKVIKLPRNISDHIR